MTITEVQVIAPVGTSFGLVKSDDGVLRIVVMPSGETEWPHGIVPNTGLNQIAPGCTRYCVEDDANEYTQPIEEKLCPPLPS